MLWKVIKRIQLCSGTYYGTYYGLAEAPTTEWNRCQAVKSSLRRWCNLQRNLGAVWDSFRSIYDIWFFVPTQGTVVRFPDETGVLRPNRSVVFSFVWTIFADRRSYANFSISVRTISNWYLFKHAFIPLSETKAVLEVQPLRESNIFGMMRWVVSQGGDNLSAESATFPAYERWIGYLLCQDASRFRAASPPNVDRFVLRSVLLPRNWDKYLHTFWF